MTMWGMLTLLGLSWLGVDPPREPPHLAPTVKRGDKLIQDADLSPSMFKPGFAFQLAAIRSCAPCEGHLLGQNGPKRQWMTTHTAPERSAQKCIEDLNKLVDSQTFQVKLMVTDLFGEDGRQLCMEGYFSPMRPAINLQTPMEQAKLKAVETRLEKARIGLSQMIAARRPKKSETILDYQRNQIKAIDSERKALVEQKIRQAAEREEIYERVYVRAIVPSALAQTLDRDRVLNKIVEVHFRPDVIEPIGPDKSINRPSIIRVLYGEIVDVHDLYKHSQESPPQAATTENDLVHHGAAEGINE